MKHCGTERLSFSWNSSVSCLVCFRVNSMVLNRISIQYLIWSHRHSNVSHMHLFKINPSLRSSRPPHPQPFFLPPCTPETIVSPPSVRFTPTMISASSHPIPVPAHYSIRMSLFSPLPPAIKPSSPRHYRRFERRRARHRPPRQRHFSPTRRTQQRTGHPISLLHPIFRHWSFRFARRRVTRSRNGFVGRTSGCLSCRSSAGSLCAWS